MHTGARLTFSMPSSGVYFHLAVPETLIPTSVAMPTTVKLLPLQDSVPPPVFLSPNAVHHPLALVDMNELSHTQIYFTLE